jgi:hypothetical protein
MSDTQLDQGLEYEIVREALSVLIARHSPAWANASHRSRLIELERVRASLDPDAPQSMILARKLISGWYGAATGAGQIRRIAP